LRISSLLSKLRFSNVSGRRFSPVIRECSQSVFYCRVLTFFANRLGKTKRDTITENLRKSHGPFTTRRSAVCKRDDLNYRKLFTVGLGEYQSVRCLSSFLSSVLSMTVSFVRVTVMPAAGLPCKRCCLQLTYLFCSMLTQIQRLWVAPIFFMMLDDSRPKTASCRGSLCYRACPWSAAAIHSMAVNGAPNPSIEMPTLYLPLSSPPKETRSMRFSIDSKTPVIISKLIVTCYDQDYGSNLVQHPPFTFAISDATKHKCDNSSYKWNHDQDLNHRHENCNRSAKMWYC